MKTHKFNTVQQDLENEVWKSTIRQDCLISNFGRIKMMFKTREPYYTLGSKSRGYYVLNIHQNGKLKTQYKVHDLVFEAFYRKLQPNEIVHHLSQVKTDNVVTNLVAIDRALHTEHHASNRSQETLKKKSQSMKKSWQLKKKGI